MDMMWGSHCKEKESYLSREWLTENNISPDEDGTYEIRCNRNSDIHRSTETFRTRFIIVDNDILGGDYMLGTGYKESSANGSIRGRGGSVGSHSANGDDGLDPMQQFLREPDAAQLSVMRPSSSWDDEERIAARLTAELSIYFARRRQQLNPLG